jgi:hypothetical protein
METWRVFLYHKIKYKYAKAIGADPTTPGERSVVAFFNPKHVLLRNFLRYSEIFTVE